MSHLGHKLGAMTSRKAVCSGSSPSNHSSPSNRAARTRTPRAATSPLSTCSAPCHLSAAAHDGATWRTLQSLPRDRGGEGDRWHAARRLAFLPARDGLGPGGLVGRRWLNGTPKVADFAEGACCPASEPGHIACRDRRFAPQPLPTATAWCCPADARPAVFQLAQPTRPPSDVSPA